MKRIKNFYLVSANFNGQGRGFAIGFDDEAAAYIVARTLLFGFGDVIPDWLMEQKYPQYFHQLVSKTAKR